MWVRTDKITEVDYNYRLQLQQNQILTIQKKKSFFNNITVIFLYQVC